MPLSTPSLRDSKSEALAFFRNEGYLVERGLWSAEDCAHLIDVANSFPNAADGSFRPIPMPHLAHEDFMRAMQRPRLVETVETLVGGTASGIGGEFFFMRPGTPGFARHQDNTYIQAPPDEFVSAWTALCDVTSISGSLTFYPRSHRLGQLPTQPTNEPAYDGQNPRARAEECMVPEGFMALDVEVERGTTVFFHSLLIHGSHPNVSLDRFRHSLLFTYIRKGRPFRAGNLQRRSEIDLHAQGSDR